MIHIEVVTETVEEAAEVVRRLSDLRIPSRRAGAAACPGATASANDRQAPSPTLRAIAGGHGG